MPLKDYSTKIDPYTTIGQIQRLLAAHGAAETAIQNTDGRPSGVRFTLPTRDGPRAYLLPANIPGVEKRLRQDYLAKKIPSANATPEQAHRTGWRIILDWIAAQAAIIEAGMVEMDAIFLPFMLLSDSKTVYQTYRDGEGPILLGPGPTDV